MYVLNEIKIFVIIHDNHLYMIYDYKVLMKNHVLTFDHQPSLMTIEKQHNEDDLNVNVLHEFYIYFQNIQLPNLSLNVIRLNLFVVKLTRR